MYVQTSPFARAVYTTTATQILVTIQSPMRATISARVGIGIYVDGVFKEAIVPPDENEYQKTIWLARGSKKIEFVNGLQTSPTQTFPPLGTYFVTATANAGMTAVSETATNRILVYGDSIAVGSNSTIPTKEAWAILLRNAHYPNSVAVEAFGYRSLYMDGSDSTARAGFVSKIVAYNPTILWMAIGTNDHGLNKWSAASFGTAYAALLDDLHTEMPGLSIYCQTLLSKTNEGANAFGSTASDFRTQISTAVSTRTSFCTLVDGTSIMTIDSLDDGTHPTDAGHILYADYVKTTLGIV